MLQEAFCAICERTVQVVSDDHDPTCPVCSSPLATLQVLAPEPSPAPKVLIVDDHPGTRGVLRILFEHDGFEVVGESQHGIAALGVALSKRPDFVILDYAMPMLSGKMTAEVLRTVLPEACIVAFSAYVFEKPSWAHAFVNKEDLVELTRVVKELALERGKPEASRPQPAAIPAVDPLPTN